MDDVRIQRVRMADGRIREIKVKVHLQQAAPKGGTVPEAGPQLPGPEPEGGAVPEAGPQLPGPESEGGAVPEAGPQLPGPEGADVLEDELFGLD